MMLISKNKTGAVLVEITIAVSALVGVAMAGMQTISSAIRTQQWVIRNALSDAAIGVEEAQAKSIRFTQIESDPKWPTFPDVATETISMGRTAEQEVTGRVTRTKRANVDEVSKTSSFQLEVYLEYTVYRQACFKARKVVRVQ